MGLSDQSQGEARAREEQGGDVTDITAGAAVLARTDKFISFERAVHIVQRQARSSTRRAALGDLSDDEEHLTGLELQGGCAHRDAERGSRAA